MNYRDIRDILEDGELPLTVTFWGGPDINAAVKQVLDIIGQGGLGNHHDFDFKDTKLDNHGKEYFKDMVNLLVKHVEIFTDTPQLTADDLIKDAMEYCMVDGSQIDKDKFEFLCAEKLAEAERREAERKKIVAAMNVIKKRNYDNSQKRPDQTYQTVLSNAIAKREAERKGMGGERRRLHRNPPIDRLIRESERCQTS